MKTYASFVCVAVLFVFFSTADSKAQTVSTALDWIAAHQRPDGSWCFDHRVGPCDDRCSGYGSLKESLNASTAMALLPFLGAGQTHKCGEYKDTVQRGLDFLVQNMKVDQEKNFGSMFESGGRLYSHGLATIALCEAYGMTADKKLAEPAQLALNYIEYAQDPLGGGWRYSPRQPGDTSVFGWQCMALKSGFMGYLEVQPDTIERAGKFLDSVAADGGAQYGYLTPATGRSATTAVGLLCRMSLGWERDHPKLVQGIDILDKMGPSTKNLYYNYYATQVMHHAGTKEQRTRWNQKLRDFLTNTQNKEGHAKGSWYFSSGDHGSQRGGRLYCTSLATLSLEIYYRHLPIFSKQMVEEKFEFDEE